MKLKNLLRVLFNLSGSQAMPKSTQKTITTVNRHLDYVAPDNGYVCLTTSNAQADWKRLSLEYDSIDFLTQGVTSYFGSGWFPVKKGQTVLADLTSGGSPVTGTLVFLKTVGGGLTAFCRWLKRGFGEVCYV